MNELQAIWIWKYNIHLSKRIALYNQLVKPLIVYNCSTWAMQKADAESLDAFHRQQPVARSRHQMAESYQQQKSLQANRIPDIFVRMAAIRSHSSIAPNVHRKSGDEVLF
jgi:hypothetical protein